MNKKGKERSTWESEGYNHFGAISTSVNDFRPLVLRNATQISPEVFATPKLPLAAGYACSVMGAPGTDTNDLRMNPPAIADSSGRSMSRTASMRGINELGHSLDASALVLHMKSSGEKQLGEAADGLEVVAVASRLEGPDGLGEKSRTTQMMRGGGSESRSLKPRADDRSRFRPCGYI